MERTKVYPREGRKHGCGGGQRRGWRAVAEASVKTERGKKYTEAGGARMDQSCEKEKENNKGL